VLSLEKRIDLAFTQIAERRLGLLYTADTFYQTLRDKLVALAMRHKIPAMYEWRTFVDAGGLASYSTVRTEAFELAGVYVGRILNGASPKDLPVIRTTKFEFVINRKTAKTLGIEIPPKLLFTADEVIE
jgi:putative ABC transport system substrate-binding protein